MLEFEKRKVERFSLELPIYLRIFDKDKKQEPLKFITSNICSGGAFFKTEKTLTVGTNVKLDIILPLNKFKNVKGKTSRINISGSVIRTDQQGMAICFDKRYKITPHWKGD